MDAKKIAEVCHEVNRAYCEAIGDSLQRHWSSAEGEEHQSKLIAGVEYALSADRTPVEMHQVWFDNMVDAGWNYGEEMDMEKKTHPCMLPYDELSLEQRVKDHLFLAIVRALKDIECIQAPTVVESIKGKVSVQYIGRRETLKDPLYGTGLWKKGEIKSVSPDVAEKLLKHPDQFQRVAVEEDVAAEHVEEQAEEKHEESFDENEVARDSIMAMDQKAALVEFAKVNFGQKLDARASVKGLQANCINLLDQFGMPGSEVE